MDANYEKILISFFIQYNVSYYLQKPIIIFSCFHCGRECRIDIKTTKWECIHCNESGMLQQLISFVKVDNSWLLLNKKVYNPRDEKNKIIKELSHLKSNNEKEITKVIRKVSELFDYLISELQMLENMKRNSKR